MNCFINSVIPVLLLPYNIKTSFFLEVYNSSSRVKGDDGFRVLFDNLNSSDAALIVQDLEKNKIPYKIPQDGVIEVPKDMVQKVRLQVASLGLPKKAQLDLNYLISKNLGLPILSKI